MGNVFVILNTINADREEAKRKAHQWIGGNPDKYIVEPIATKQDRVRFDITLQV
jgi:hypothetical protein